MAHQRPAPVRKTRRTDPERRDRIVDACFDVIAEAGVAGASARRIAQAADVPLGSITYHFSGMDELLRVAFERFADEVSNHFEQRLADARNAQEAEQEVIALVTQDVVDTQRNLILTHELYTLAARRSAFREIADAWIARSRHALEHCFDPTTARLLDALLEGLTIRRALDSEPPHPDTVASAIRRITAGANQTAG